MNHQFGSTIEIVRSTVTKDCGDEKCLEFKNLRVGRNKNRGIANWTCGVW
jgi:hypothetical protein